MSTSRERKRRSIKSKRRTPLLILMLIMLSAVLPPVFTLHAGADVDLHLIVNLPFEENIYEDTSILGMRDSATQGFDTAWDNLDPPPPFTGVVSYFWYPDNPTTPVDFRKLSISRISWSDTRTWIYRLQPVGLSGTATISWDSAEIGLIPSNYTILLLDSEGTVIADMRTVFEYNFVAEESIIYEFTIQMPEIISISVDPTSIDFDSIIQGQSSESQTITITSTSNVDVYVTASVTGETTPGFYDDNLELEFEYKTYAVSGFEMNILVNEPPKVVGVILSVPLNAPTGLQEGTLVFWAETP